MSDRAKQADIGDTTPATDLARWSADPGLAPIFRTREGIVLVLDAQGEHVLHASECGAALRAAITGDGRGAGTRGAGLARRFAERLRSATTSGGTPRLVRIRFDTRGIARPTSCLVARARDAAGEAVLLLAPTEPLPRLRTPTVRPPDEDVPRPAPIAASIQPRRFTWRSDAAGFLTQVTGADLAAHLVGRSWETLAESGTVAEPSLLAAIRARQTFRALPLRLRPPGVDHEIAIDLSGSPSARPTQSFAGFSGFGILRETRPIDRMRAIEPAEPSDRQDGGARVAESETATGNADDPMPTADLRDEDDASSLADPEDASVRESTSDEAGSEAEDVQAGGPAARDGPVAHGDHATDAEPSSERAAASSAGHDLSTHEHAAFREIARALGARFAGDETASSPESVPGPERRGAVMAFPSTTARTAGAAIEAAIVSALDRLPAGVLVHRDGETLYVNHRFLELADHPDRTALQAADTLAQLLGRLPQRDSDVPPDAPIALTTGGGGLLAVVVERSRVDWDGTSAELLLVRAAAQADQTRDQIARSLLRSRDATRERDAYELLDHVAEGIASLDEDGRVLSLNGGATAMLASDPREIVGGALADLFTPDSRPAIAASLREAREGGASEPREVEPRTHRRSAPLQMRIVPLTAANSARFCVTLRDSGTPVAARSQDELGSGQRADFLARVRHGIRAPLTEIRANVEAVLSESLGPLGNERYRDHLSEIRERSEHVLGVVDDLVDLARIEAGRSELTFTDIVLNDVVSGCIALMQPQAARDRIVVRTSLSPDLRPLLADERSMRQATLNVIANAIRLTEAGGQVIVSTTTAERGEIAFRVRDTGIGMTQEEIERALAPFDRNEVVSGRGGSGLELTLTKALVEANRGRFLITSRKNEGTLVEMLFPPPRALSA